MEMKKANQTEAKLEIDKQQKWKERKLVKQRLIYRKLLKFWQWWKYNDLAKVW